MFVKPFEDEKCYFYFQVSPKEKKRKEKKRNLKKARERLLLFPTDGGLATELLYRDTPPTAYINWQANTAAFPPGACINRVSAQLPIFMKHVELNTTETSLPASNLLEFVHRIQKLRGTQPQCDHTHLIALEKQTKSK